jgi:uncharacterized protein (TIGR03435 family)
MIINAMRITAIAWAMILTGAYCANAQTSPPKLDFEVASLKPSGPQSIRRSNGGPGTRDPERYSYMRADLRDLIFEAYGLRHYDQQTAGPGWIDTEEYDIVAKMPPGTTKEQFQQMLQNLLAERFHLVIHHETRVLPVFDLVVGKNGPKLKESAVDVGASPAPSLRPGEVDRQGFPVLLPGRRGFASNFGPDGSSHSTGHQATMSLLADMLSGPNAADRLVIDKTGLTGKYDLTLEYAWRPAGAGVNDDPGLSIFDAVQQQLGLKLVDAKEPFDVVVVDRANKVPIEN